MKKVYLVIQENTGQGDSKSYCIPYAVCKTLESATKFMEYIQRETVGDVHIIQELIVEW